VPIRRSLSDSDRQFYRVKRAADTLDMSVSKFWKCVKEKKILLTYICGLPGITAAEMERLTSGGDHEKP
jgi:hypothetical protein